MDGYDDKKALGAVVKSMGDAARRAKAAKYGPKPKPQLTDVMHAAESPEARLARKRAEFEEEGSELPSKMEIEIMSGGAKSMPDMPEPDELQKILESVLGK